MSMKQATYRYKYVNELFIYIESNISDELETTLLSIIGYVAHDKLYKDFYSLSLLCRLWQKAMVSH